MALAVRLSVHSPTLFPFRVSEWRHTLKHHTSSSDFSGCIYSDSISVSGYVQSHRNGLIQEYNQTIGIDIGGCNSWPLKIHQLLSETVAVSGPASWYYVFVYRTKCLWQQKHHLLQL